MSSASPLRHQLCQTALQLGPDAPTLCPPWDVRALVAHLVTRESRPDALPGIGLDIGVLTRRTAQLQQGIATDLSFSGLVGRFRDGPPPWWPTRVPGLDSVANTAEFAIHHEDMVRAQHGWEPTVFSPEVDQVLWRTLGTTGRLLYRAAPVGVVAIAETQRHPRRVLRRPRPGHGSVVLRGLPIDLVLHAFGRTTVALVEVEGSERDITAFGDAIRDS